MVTVYSIPTIEKKAYSFSTMYEDNVAFAVAGNNFHIVSVRAFVVVIGFSVIDPTLKVLIEVSFLVQ